MARDLRSEQIRILLTPIERARIDEAYRLEGGRRSLSTWAADVLLDHADKLDVPADIPVTRKKQSGPGRPKTGKPRRRKGET